jgi:hypothetical protein
MSGYVWDLSGTNKQCELYEPGHQIHWIHFNHSMREPSVVIPVTAAVDDDGLVHIEGDDLSLVRWNHRPALVRAALQRFRRGRVRIEVNDVDALVFCDDLAALLHTDGSYDDSPR